MTLSMKNVSKVYKEGETQIIALDQVSMEVASGEFVAIIGPSGSGKSTFLSIAGALLKPSQGEVEINNKNIATLKDKELSDLRLHEIGFILQTSNLMPYLNILDNLLVIKKMSGKVTKQDEAFAKELLTGLGLTSKFGKFPNELSGGERQRVAIARSFMNDSSLILADEPTASLDTNRANEVVSLISKEVKARGKAAVMVTHDERMLANCDRVYRMEDGKLTLQ
ncbi:ABC transporter ATP-binding protein [Sporosarcina beigongshangi]|uniref:ABC transporter ATP-binding protein n=1 Tax=Sporosarcina beigongshangi TaxID=2782538 RepID=UPI001939F841|nr:ABC transporter ATP-binding protein [Sporosarcina beigongshangi]